MLIFFAVLILVASVVLGFFVLVQNPKGGGLSGSFGGFSNQTMGVRQTTDFLEKGTWVLIIIIGGLCLFSSFFIPHAGTSTQPKSMMEQNVKLPTPPATQFPASGAQSQAPASTSNPTSDSGK